MKRYRIGEFIFEPADQQEESKFFKAMNRLESKSVHTIKDLTKVLEEYDVSVSFNKSLVEEIKT